MKFSNFHWDDLRVAWLVAETGSLTRAADQLGLNHSTVLRRVGRLEESLGAKLFIRHQRGYQLTDAGQLMLKSMRPIASDIQRLHNGLSVLEQEPSGTLRITTVSDFSQVFAPMLHAFRDRHSHIRVQVLATDDYVPLSSGDAHVAIRMGDQPKEPDLIARPIMPMKMEYFATDAYINRYGKPSSLAEINQHYWVIPSGKKQKLNGIRQLVEELDQNRIVFQSNSFSDIYSAIQEGMGIGPIDGLQRFVGSATPLRKISLGINGPDSIMWFVYHKDMRGSARIKALQDFMLENLPNMIHRIG
ncbi:MAG: LysR family transcriptional regulator [Oceanobacter sp.]